MCFTVLPLKGRVKSLFPFIDNSIPSISEDTAREAFILFASSKCCYSAAPAKDGVITNMEAFNTYRVSGCIFKIKSKLCHVTKLLDITRNSKICVLSAFPLVSTAWKPSLSQDLQIGNMSLTMVKYYCITYH